jgi:hypothetical protein
MGFRDFDDSQAEVWELVRVNRSTGAREIVRDRVPIQGRWTADAALRRATESNRDPSVTFEIQTAAASRKKFRAAAFGEATEQIPAYKDPNDSGRFRS